MQPLIQFTDVCFRYPEAPAEFFSGLQAQINTGITCLVGPNGIGKTTFMLLAGGRLKPDNGTVAILGKNSASYNSEEELQKAVSMVYQNMEFETNEPIETLLHSVLENGFLAVKDSALIKEMTVVFELQNILAKKTQEISKGEIQRLILAFSLLYGSQIVLLDEPVFALEDRQKNICLDYIRDYAKKNQRHFIVSLHEIHLAQKYCSQAVLFCKSASKKNPILKIGEAASILSKENIEQAYLAPIDTIRQQEFIHRSYLCGRNQPPKDTNAISSE